MLSAVEDATTGVINQYIGQLGRRPCLGRLHGRLPSAAFGLRQFLEVLRIQGLIAPASPQPTAEDRWLNRFAEHLVRLCRKNLEEMAISGQVIAIDMSDLSSAYHSADRAFRVPPCFSPDFVGSVFNLAREHQIGLVIPTIDPELPGYSRHRDEFSKHGITVVISKPETIDLTNDKVNTHRWLEEKGFPTVRQSFLEEVLSEPEAWEFPLIVKPRAGSASRGVFRVNTGEQLAFLARQSDAEDLIVQVPAPGREYTVDVLVNRSGRCVCAVPRKRLEVRAGEVSKGITVRHPMVEGLAKSIAEALPGSYGPMNIQIFHDADSGALNVVEINPRFGGGYPLTKAAGGLYIRWILEELLELDSTLDSSLWSDGLDP